MVQIQHRIGSTSFIDFTRSNVDRSTREDQFEVGRILLWTIKTAGTSERIARRPAAVSPETPMAHSHEINPQG
jgi:hypothetical protein